MTGTNLNELEQKLRAVLRELKYGGDSEVGDSLVFLDKLGYDVIIEKTPDRWRCIINRRMVVYKQSKGRGFYPSTAIRKAIAQEIKFIRTQRRGFIK